MEEEMGMACSMYGRENKHVQVSSGETWKKETTWQK